MIFPYKKTCINLIHVPKTSSNWLLSIIMLLLWYLWRALHKFCKFVFPIRAQWSFLVFFGNCVAWAAIFGGRPRFIIWFRFASGGRVWSPFLDMSTYIYYMHLRTWCAFHALLMGSIIVLYHSMWLVRLATMVFSHIVRAGPRQQLSRAELGWVFIPTLKLTLAKSFAALELLMQK